MKNRKGFTLIELMIVIAIIGILAAMAMPNFRTSRWQARQKACYSNIRVIQGAVEMYNMDNPSFISAGGSNLNPLTNGYLKAIPACPEWPGSATQYQGSNLEGTGHLYCGTDGQGGTISDLGRNHGSIDG